MNGFVAFAGVNGLACDPNRIAPVEPSKARLVFPSEVGSPVLTWGEEQGDVCLAAGRESFVIVSGYVLEIPNETELGTQIENAHAVRRILDGLPSAAALGGFIRGLRGSFAIVYHNASSGDMICVTDRVASRPLWWKWKNPGWIVSSHAMAVALSTQALALDPVALSTFLLYGGSIEPTCSLFAEVKSAPPGIIVRLNRAGCLESYCWHDFRHRPDQQRSLQDWLDLARGRLVGSAARLLRRSRRPAIFFSGGVDSRLAAAALKAAGGDPLLVTLGDSRNIEVRVASAAAKALSLTHKVILRDHYWYCRSLPRSVYETAASYVFTHGHFSRAAKQISMECGSDVFLLGDLCEAFSKLLCSTNGVQGRLWTSEEFADRFDSLRLPLYRPVNRNATLSLLKGALRTDVLDGMRRQIMERYERVLTVSEDPLIVGDYFFRWQSLPTIPTFFMFLDLRSVAAERNLMLDPDVLDLLQLLPSNIRDGRNFGSQLIGRLRPQAAWIPNANTLLPLRWPASMHKASLRMKPYLGRFRRRAIGDSHRTSGSWPNHAFSYVHRPAWRKIFESVLSDGDLFDSSIFDVDAVRRCWQAFVEGDHRRVGDIEKLLQLGLTKRLLYQGWTDFIRSCDFIPKSPAEN